MNHLKAVLLQGDPSIRAIAEYILSKSAGDPSLHDTLQTILGHDPPSHLGFIFSERLVNMPVEVIPHMYYRSTYCANSPIVAKLHFLPCSGQLLPSDFLSLVNVMSHHVVPSFRMRIH